MLTPSASPSNSLTFTSSKGDVSATVYSTGGWQQKTFYLAAGLQSIGWGYTRNTVVQSPGWVDQVSFTPGATLPTITSVSPDASVRANSSVTFTVNAFGTPPLAYQWQLNGTNLLNKTNAVLNLTNVQLANAGDYAVVITNGYGTSATNTALWVAQFGLSTSPTNLFMSTNGFQIVLEGILRTKSGGDLGLDQFGQLVAVVYELSDNRFDSISGCHCNKLARTFLSRPGMMKGGFGDP